MAFEPVPAKDLTFALNPNIDRPHHATSHRRQSTDSATAPDPILAEAEKIEKLPFSGARIASVDRELAGLQAVQESLKWGEPSYTRIMGSAVKFARKESAADTFAVCFHCSTKLVSAFRILYGKALRFEGNRAIAFRAHEEIPTEKLEKCIELALTYHQRKRLPMLGA